MAVVAKVIGLIILVVVLFASSYIFLEDAPTFSLILFVVGIVLAIVAALLILKSGKKKDDGEKVEKKEVKDQK